MIHQDIMLSCFLVGYHISKPSLGPVLVPKTTSRMTPHDETTGNNYYLLVPAVGMLKHCPKPSVASLWSRNIHTAFSKFDAQLESPWDLIGPARRLVIFWNWSEGPWDRYQIRPQRKKAIARGWAQTSDQIRIQIYTHSDPFTDKPFQRMNELS